MDVRTDIGERPVVATDRIETLDLLRGVAICGILLMNIQSMGTFDHYSQPVLPAAWNANWILWGVQRLFFEGTMRGLFTLLFGAGMLLMLRRAEGANPQVTPIDVWTRRCLLLMGLGCVQWLVLLWPGEILWNYGTTGLFLLAFRRAQPPALLRASLVLLVAIMIFLGVDDVQSKEGLRTGFVAEQSLAAHRPITAEQRTALDDLVKARAGLRDAPTVTGEEYAKRTHYATLVAWSWDEWSKWNIGYEQWGGLLESGCFMLVGMMLFRLRILTGEAQAATYRWMMLAGYGGGVVMRGAMIALKGQFGFDLVPASVAPSIALPYALLYEPGRMLVTLGHVGLLLTLWRGGLLGRAAPVRALGRMALTTYLLQSLITSILFYGFGLVGRFGFAGLVGITVCVWLATGAFATAWLRRHDMGPVERLLRRFAYGRSPKPAVVPAL